MRGRRSWSRRLGRGCAGAFRYKDDGIVEVHRWMCNGISSVDEQGCKQGELENEYLPAWTKKAIGKIWQEVPADVEASNAFSKSTACKSTDFLRHVVSEEERRRCYHVHVRQ